MRRSTSDAVLRKTKDLRELPIVRVHWHDATGSTAWRTLENARARNGLKCETVGYLTKNTRTTIQVAATINEDGDLGDTVTIPRVWQIGQVEVLRRGKKRKAKP